MKIVFGIVLAAGLAATHLPAQTAWHTGALPLSFEANRGQAVADAAFVAHGPDSEFLLSATGAQFVLRNTASQIAARLQFVNANPAARIFGDAPQASRVNYFISNQPSNWLTDVPTFGRVQVNNVYPGVNVIYYGNGRQLEYDFTVASGVDPRTIALRFEGAEGLSVDSHGQLVVRLNGGEIIQHAPLAYQQIGAARQEVRSGYKILDAHTAAFALGDYDHGLPLVIDPVLNYSSYFGGDKDDVARAIAVDKDGCIYIAGSTLSTVFTNIASGGYETTFRGGTQTGDAFVAKFDSTTKTNLYFTYIGGSGEDAAYGLALDAQGNAYITGYTGSSNYPTNNALFGYKSGLYPLDGFVTELNTNGSKLVYSTYLGGNTADAGYAIAVDAAANAYIAGFTTSTNLPVTATALQKTLLCTNTIYFNQSAFVAELSAFGTNLLYLSYLGGHNYEQANSIFVDASNYVYVAGFTASTNFPSTNALAGFKRLDGATTKAPSEFDAFVCKFQPGCSNWVYSTFLGGTNDDAVTGVAADGSGNAYVVGWTVSTNFIHVITNNFPGAYAANLMPNGLTNNLTLGTRTTNSFLVKIAPANGSLTNIVITNAVIFGGSKPIIHASDIAQGVALDGAGNIFIVGSATSTNFPITVGNLPGSLRATNSGASDVFVTAIKADWTGLLYSTYLGGAQNDFGNAIAVDPVTGNAYITGETFSTNYPVFKAQQSQRYGPSDAFVTEILLTNAIPNLTASAAANKILLSWQASGQQLPGYYQLETSSNLLDWLTVTNPSVITNNGSFSYPFDTTNPAEFFRLRLR